MSHKGGEKFQIESLRLSINEHMASVREEISCVVNERLSSVEQFMCSLFQREIETLLERRGKLLDVILQPHIKLHGAGETTGAPQRPNASGGGGQVAETEVPVHHPGQHHWTLGSNQDGGKVHTGQHHWTLGSNQDGGTPTVHPGQHHWTPGSNQDGDMPTVPPGQHHWTLGSNQDGGTVHPGQHHWTLGSNQDGGDRPRVRGRRRLPGGTDEQPETERAEPHQLQVQHGQPGGRPPDQPGVPHLQLHHGDQFVETSLQVKMSSPQPSWTVSVKQEPEDLDTNFLHLPVCQEEVSPEQQERSPSLVQEEPEPPHIKVEQEELLQRPEEADGSTLTLLAVKSEGDDENRDTEPVASTSTQHMQTQADVEDCGTSQPTSDDLLSSHRSESDITEHSDESEEDTWVISTECGKMFTKKAGQKTHGVTHTGEKSFTCIVCGKGFTQRSSLKSHIMTHTGEKPFTCTVCGKGCTQRGNLKSHMLTHTGVKPFNCTVCGKGCFHRGQLKIHMLTHAGEKPFTCTVCGKGCVHSGELRVHMMTHTGEKPFTCTVCGKSFNQRCNLKTHMLTHTREKSIPLSLYHTTTAVGVASIQVDHHPPGNPGILN